MIFRFREGDENSSKPPSSVAGRKSNEKQKKNKKTKKTNKEKKGELHLALFSHSLLALRRSE
jgi:hypothetical protein